VPDAAVVTLDIVGSSEVDVKLFGPVQLYVEPATVFEVRLKVCPEQTVLLLPTIGVAGVGFTVTESVPTDPLQPDTDA
jgi:hypothetical protein